MKTVEKVARALAYSHYYQRFGSYNSEQVKLNVDGNWNAFVDDAIAAIGAMKDPEPKILNAACKALSPGYTPTEDRVSNKQKHKIRFNAMIDEAVSQAEKLKYILNLEVMESGE